MDNRGSIGFNNDSTKFITALSGGTLRVNDFDPNQFTTAIGASKELGYPFLRTTTGAYFFPDVSTAFWSGANDAEAPNTLIVASGMSYYKLNVVTGIATPLANLNSLMIRSITALGTPSLYRCSASTDTRTIGCSILLRTSTGYPRMGYVVFSILSQNPTNPAKNWTLKAKFINGIDSPNIQSFQSIQRTGSDAVTYSFPFYNALEGGYKVALDKSGRYLTIYLWPTDNNTSAVMDTVKLAANQQPYSFVQTGGHGDMSDGFYVGISLSPNPNIPRIAKRWDFASLTADPNPTRNNGTIISAPFNFAEGFEYVNFFSGIGEATFSFACPVGGCGPAPAALQGEIVNLKMDGSGTIRRLAQMNNVRDPNVFYQPLQTFQNPDGRFVAFSSNFGDTTGRAHVFVIRVP